MDFEWDDAKALENRRNYGVRFEIAAGVFDDPHRYEDADDRQDYGELRLVTVGRAGRRFLAVVFTERGSAIRIISARKATRDERQRYHALPP
jgi:uncharacterized protein